MTEWSLIKIKCKLIDNSTTSVRVFFNEIVKSRACNRLILICLSQTSSNRDFFLSDSSVVSQFYILQFADTMPYLLPAWISRFGPISFPSFSLATLLIPSPILLRYLHSLFCINPCRRTEPSFPVFEFDFLTLQWQYIMALYTHELPLRVNRNLSRANTPAVFRYSLRVQKNL